MHTCSQYTSMHQAYLYLFAEIVGTVPLPMHGGIVVTKHPNRTVTDLIVVSLLKWALAN